jgi:Nucleotidyltransferase domain
LPVLPDDVRRRVDVFVKGLDQLLPGAVSGLYLVGSLALGDYHERRSNIDLVVVGDSAWDAEQLAHATKLHHHLERRGFPPRVGYTTFEELMSDPSAGATASFEGTRRLAAGEFANPFTWYVVGNESVAMRGPEWIEHWEDEEALRSWAGDRLAGRWSQWAAACRRRPWSLWTRRPVTESLLEVTRLHVAVTRGQVVSKLVSGEIAMGDLAERFQRVIRDAVGHRRGVRTSMYWGPLERRRHALRLVDELTEGATESARKPT